MLSNISVIQGSWKKKLIERVHNAAKPGHNLDTPAPPPKHGRDTLLERYPTVSQASSSGTGQRAEKRNTKKG